MNSQLSAVWCGKPGNQINADIADADGAQPGDVIQRDRAGMQAANRRTFLIDERLHAQADAIDAAMRKGLPALGR